MQLPQRPYQSPNTSVLCHTRPIARLAYTPGRWLPPICTALAHASAKGQWSRLPGRSARASGPACTRDPAPNPAPPGCACTFGSFQRGAPAYPWQPGPLPVQVGPRTCNPALQPARAGCTSGPFRSPALAPPWTPGCPRAHPDAGTFTCGPERTPGSPPTHIWVSARAHL